LLISGHTKGITVSRQGFVVAFVAID